MATLNMAAVVLAAGHGQRMGGVAKALLRVQGRPLVSRLLSALREAGVSDAVVVTGAHHEQIAPLVEAQGARVVCNPKPGDGQRSSIRLGLQAVAQGAEADAVLMVLCDQPLIDSADIQELLKAFTQNAGYDFCVPTVNGKRGNPVVVSRRALGKILLHDDEIGCREFMQRHPETVWRHETRNEHFLLDLDTEADLQALRLHTGWVVDLPESGPL